MSDSAFSFRFTHDFRVATAPTLAAALVNAMEAIRVREAEVAREQCDSGTSVLLKVATLPPATERIEIILPPGTFVRG